MIKLKIYHADLRVLAWPQVPDFEGFCARMSGATDQILLHFVSALTKAAEFVVMHLTSFSAWWRRLECSRNRFVGRVGFVCLIVPMATLGLGL